MLSQSFRRSLREMGTTKRTNLQSRIKLIQFKAQRKLQSTFSIHVKERPSTFRSHRKCCQSFARVFFLCAREEFISTDLSTFVCVKFGCRKKAEVENISAGCTSTFLLAPFLRLNVFRCHCPGFPFLCAYEYLRF